jgi:rhodanese-related sulfurtransferase
VLAVLATACGASAPTVAPAGTGAAAVEALPAEADVATAASLRAAGAFVLDVREPAEWAAGHIAGATLVPLGELSKRLAEVPKDRRVVVVCRSGNRSAQGRDILLGAGYPSATSMAGGMGAWASAGLEVVTGQ